MTSMTSTAVFVTGGVDTHGQTHHAAAIDQVGRQLGDREFPTTPAGYRALLSWLQEHGSLERVGMEGTGAYGAGLARHLHDEQVDVVEVDRPDRKARRAHGKSDPLDAYAAARAALSGTATGTPKTRNGAVESIRALRMARSSAVKARTQATNQLKALLLSGPAELREQLRQLSTTALITTCARLRPTSELTDPEQATKTALRRLARRHQQLSEEIAEADRELRALVARRPRRGCSLCLGSASRWPDNCSPAPGTTPTGSARSPPSRSCAASHPCRRAAARCAATASTAAATGRPTRPSTSSSSDDCGRASAPEPTSSGAPRRACPSPRSSGASSATWRGRSISPYGPFKLERILSQRLDTS